MYMSYQISVGEYGKIKTVDLKVTFSKALITRNCLLYDKQKIKLFEQIINQSSLVQPDGEKVAVTNSNREEFVALYLDYILNTAVKER